MIITKKQELNRSYTVFSGKQIDPDSYSVQMVLHHLLDSLLCSYLHMLNNAQIWCCEHTGKKSLKEYCENHELDSETIKWIWRGVLEAVLEAEEFLLDVDCLYLDVDEIYLSSEEYRVSVCYVPFEKEPVWKRMTDLAQFLLGYLDQRDGQAVQMAYGIFRYLSQGGSSVDEMWRLIQELELKKEEPLMDAVSMDIKSESKDSVVTEKKKIFLTGRWILTCLPTAVSVFLAGLVALNEWYLPDGMKILLIAAAVLLGGISFILWRKWGLSFKKESFYDEDDTWAKENIQSGWPRLLRKDTGESIIISQIPSIIGKLPETAQILIQEPTVSRIHAKLTLIDGEYYLEDLNSKNGTYVDGKRLEAQKPVRLKGNDMLAFADIQCYFQLSNR